jgi:hypothetical protein
MNTTNTSSTTTGSSSSSSNKNSSKDDTAVDIVVLECGASLAEQEHTSPNTREDEDDDDNNGNNDTTVAAVRKEEQHFLLGRVQDKNGSGGDDTSGGGRISTLEALRSAIASDVLTGSSIANTGRGQPSYTTFTSPFAVPKQRQSNDDDKNHNTGSRCNRFLQLPLVYCDQTASNRPLQSLERYIQSVCLPLFGNTHTNTSITGAQSTAFCAEARQIVAEQVNAKVTGKASRDVVLFA